MVRAVGAILVVAVVALGLLVARGSRPYPYPVAYKLGYQYREESLKEEGWQEQFRTLHPYAGSGGLKLTRFWPRFADSTEGAVACWGERRKALGIPYLETGTMRRREPTAEETRLEKEGWVAGYMESVRQHPGPGG
jgi:hypothetical protein